MGKKGDPCVLSIRRGASVLERALLEGFRSMNTKVIIMKIVIDSPVDVVAIEIIGSCHELGRKLTMHIKTHSCCRDTLI